MTDESVAGLELDLITALSHRAVPRGPAESGRVKRRRALAGRRLRLIEARLERDRKLDQFSDKIIFRPAPAEASPRSQMSGTSHETMTAAMRSRFGGPADTTTRHVLNFRGRQIQVPRDTHDDELIAILTDNPMPAGPPTACPSPAWGLPLPCVGGLV
jgi:hypothetical protein